MEWEVVGALVVNGVAVAPGVYSVENLNAQFSDAIFLGNDAALLSVTAIPEPGIVALLGVEGVVLLCRCRRKEVA